MLFPERSIVVSNASPGKSSKSHGKLVHDFIRQMKVELRFLGLCRLKTKRYGSTEEEIQ